MNTLKYKGYLGSVSFSEEDDVFFGKIEGIDGLVNFEGASVHELKAAFYDAVDNYLVFCKENGIEPRKKYSGSLNIRIPPEIHGKIAMIAQETGTTINTVIRNMLANELKTVY